jgi:hypothetical protein
MSDPSEEAKAAWIEAREKEDDSHSALGLGVALGAGIGAAIGTATDQLGIWLPIGVAVGVSLGAGMSRRTAGE